MPNVNDVLDFLVSRTAVKSNFGAQLDRLRFGLNASLDPLSARDQVEETLLQQAIIIRCIDDFAARWEFATYKILERLQFPNQLNQGHIALNVLRNFQEWSTYSQERGLTAVYTYLNLIAPKLAPPPPAEDGELYMAFRTGKAKRARYLAAEAYGDSLLALQSHVRGWNIREARKSKRAG